MANNSKIDNQMERMQFLMEYKTTPKVDTKAGIEYHVNTSDGKTYGIIRENNMYYIKTTTPDKANIKESYEYLGGFNYRNEHGYKSFNEAAKHLELEIMCINESRGIHEDVSVVLDSNKGKKDMQALTEAARTELDRMHQIFENSGKIGHYNNPYSDSESKGTASAENTTKNNAPFEEKAEASLDKDPKFNGTVDGATPDNKEVTEDAVDNDLQSDKMKTTNSGSEKDFKDTHDDLDGEGVADKKPSGAKAVKLNEDVFESDENDINPDDFHADDIDAHADFADEYTVDDFNDNENEPTNDLAGFNDEEDIQISDFDDESTDELDDLLREFLEEPADDANVADNEPENVVNEDTDNQEPEGASEKDSKVVGPDKVLDGPHGTLKVQSWDKLQESIDRITDAIYEKLAQPKKSDEEILAESIDRIVAEEVKKLDAWGKHPRYQKPAFKTPANKEVAPNNAKDWNDNSVKGEEPYGKKIGSSAPFDKTVDMLTDAVMKQLKESYGLKKK